MIFIDILIAFLKSVFWTVVVTLVLIVPLALFRPDIPVDSINLDWFGYILFGYFLREVFKK